MDSSILWPLEHCIPFLEVCEKEVCTGKCDYSVLDSLQEVGERKLKEIELVSVSIVDSNVRKYKKRSKGVVMPLLSIKNNRKQEKGVCADINIADNNKKEAEGGRGNVLPHQEVPLE